MDLLTAAVHNNAAWVAAVHRAHGHASETHPALWLTRGQPLPFYPNAVTLTPGRAAECLAALRDLQAVLGRGWGVKDSYAALDLAPLGLAPLFDAQWVARPPLDSPPGGDLRWQPVTTPEALAAWEHAWRGRPAGEAPLRLFPPALLADPEIAFLGGYAGGALVAGVIANHSGAGAAAVTGVSNLFLPAAAADGLRASAVAAASCAFPNRPLVSYDRDADLEAMQRLGFATLGPLRVWAG